MDAKIIYLMLTRKRLESEREQWPTSRYINKPLHFPVKLNSVKILARNKDFVVAGTYFSYIWKFFSSQRMQLSNPRKGCFVQKGFFCFQLKTDSLRSEIPAHRMETVFFQLERLKHSQTSCFATVLVIIILLTQVLRKKGKKQITFHMDLV